MSLTEDDFFLYKAMVGGAYALRNLMIPCPIKSLFGFGPSDYMSQACLTANGLVKEKLINLYSNTKMGQVPIIESTP